MIKFNITYLLEDKMFKIVGSNPAEAYFDQSFTLK